MKKQKTGIIFLAVLLICSAYLYYNYRNNNGSGHTIAKTIIVNDTSEITTIQLKKNHALVTLQRTGLSWKLNDKYTVPNSKIETLLRIISLLQYKSSVPNEIQTNVVNQINTGGVQVTIKNNNKILSSYLVGGTNPEKSGTYIVSQDSNKPILIYLPGFDTDLSQFYSVDEKFWRDNSIFSYTHSEIKTIIIEHVKDTSASFKLTCVAPEHYELVSFQNIQKGKKLNLRKVEQYLLYFTGVKYKSIATELSPSQSDSILRSQPKHIITVENQNGIKNQVKTYLRPDIDQPGTFDLNNMYALINDDSTLVVIRYYDFDLITKKITYFTDNE